MNKMDRENANFAATLEKIQSKLNTRCLPIQHTHRLPEGISRA